MKIAVCGNVSTISEKNIAGNSNVSVIAGKGNAYNIAICGNSNQRKLPKTAMFLNAIIGNV